MKKQVVALVLALSVGLTGCSFALFDDAKNELKGSIKGNTYTMNFYSDYGDTFMTVTGQNIGLNGNYVKEYNSEGVSTDVLSSVVTFTVDGNELENCGSTVIIREKGLEPVVNFGGINSIDTKSKGITDWTSIATPLNEIKNKFGKSRIVVIQTDLSQPICAFEGNDCYWKIPEDLPKTTKIMIDGKALYIHRAKFQIIDKSMVD